MPPSIIIFFSPFSTISFSFLLRVYLLYSSLVRPYMHMPCSPSTIQINHHTFSLHPIIILKFCVCTCIFVFHGGRWYVLAGGTQRPLLLPSLLNHIFPYPFSPIFSLWCSLASASCVLMLVYNVIIIHISRYYRAFIFTYFSIRHINTFPTSDLFIILLYHICLHICILFFQLRFCFLILFKLTNITRPLLKFNLEVMVILKHEHFFMDDLTLSCFSVRSF